MLLSTSALFDNINWVLENEIAPAVADQPWLASYMRSINGLLPYLDARLELEGGALHADNVDARETLEAAAAAGLLTAEIGTVLATYDDRTAYRTVAELRAESTAYGEVVDRVIGLAHDGDHGALVERLRAYVLRSVERKAPIYNALGMVPF
jgi:hypothetical protein